MRHLPDAVLVRDKDVPVAPSEAVGLIESFGMTLMPFRFVRARKRDQIGHLLAFKIDYPQKLTFRELKRRACLRF